MGDVAALARNIEATGGQPLNPPVVVADGTDPDGRQTYRVVDGERRVRALWSLYGEGSDDLVDVLCFRSYDAADEAVAMSRASMLATSPLCLRLRRAAKGIEDILRGEGL